MSAQFVKVLGLFVSFLWTVNQTTAGSLRCPSYLTAHAVMAHPSDNTKYLKCDAAGYLSESMCPDGSTFDAYRLVCVTSARATNPCPCPTTTSCPPITTTKCPCPTTPTPCPTTPTPCPTTPTPDPITPTPCPTTPTPCPITPTPCPITPTTPNGTPTTPNGTPTTPNGTPTTPNGTPTTPCVGCEYGEPVTSPSPIVTTPIPEKECKTGKVDVPRPVITTPPPVECK